MNKRIQKKKAKQLVRAFADIRRLLHDWRDGNERAAQALGEWRITSEKMAARIREMRAAE